MMFSRRRFSKKPCARTTTSESFWKMGSTRYRLGTERREAPQAPQGAKAPCDTQGAKAPCDTQCDSRSNRSTAERTEGREAPKDRRTEGPNHRRTEQREDVKHRRTEGPKDTEGHRSKINYRYQRTTSRTRWKQPNLCRHRFRRNSVFYGGKIYGYIPVETNY